MNKQTKGSTRSTRMSVRNSIIDGVILGSSVGVSNNKNYGMLLQFNIIKRPIVGLCTYKSPAYNAGIRTGDVIYMIDGESTEKMTAKEIQATM